MAVAAERVEAAPRVEARGVGLRAGLVTVIFLLVALCVGLAVGPVHIGLGTIVRSALSYVPLLHLHQPLDLRDHGLLWQIRAPRVALGALVGGMLAVAGASYQGVFRNPLCDPYLLGVAGGAGIGATLAIVYASAAAAGSTWTVPLAAFGGAIAAVIVTYALGRSVGAAHGSATGCCDRSRRARRGRVCPASTRAPSGGSRRAQCAPARPRGRRQARRGGTQP